MPKFVPDTASTGARRSSGKKFVPDVVRKPPKDGGFLDALAKYSGVELAGHLGRDIGEAAVGIGPGLYQFGKGLGGDIAETVRHPWVTGAKKEALLEQWRHPMRPVPEGAPHARSAAIGQALVKDYVRRYGPLAHGDVGKVLHEAYEHPLAPALDVLTAGQLGAAARAAALGRTGERATIVTRSPRALQAGEGPVQTELTSASAFSRAREEALATRRARRTERIRKEGPREIRVGKRTVPLEPRAPGEFKKFGKGIQAEATQHVLERLPAHADYVKATKKLSRDEWAALHIRALDIHPEDLKVLWRDTPNAAWIEDPKIRELALRPSPKLVKAEQEAQKLSETGAQLFKEKGRLKTETAASRPERAREQASEVLGRPVRPITGKPYYFPHTFEEARAPSPLAVTGGGKGVPRAPGATKQNLGRLLLQGKIHMRSDVLGPEFLRRLKWAKYDEIHRALVRGSVQLTRQDIESQFSGRIPKGWTYVRTHHRERIPATARAETEEHVPLSELIPEPGDLQETALADEGFATTNPDEAHVVGGRYHIVPKPMVKAATGEFTKANDTVRVWVKQPLAVWRSLVLGLRPGYLVNNVVGTSLMYAVKTGGRGALRDLFGAIMETHGAQTAKRIADHPSTPPELRRDLYREFFPEQGMHGTFGGTQSPAVGAGRAITGALPRASSAVEAGARRALIRNLIRNSPEFRRVYKAMPRQTRTFEDAARQLLEGKGSKEFQRRISKEVNNALGSYTALGPTERNVLRNIAPFYAWYKAIATTTAHLAVDTPMRANILGRLGALGNEQSQELGEVPSYLQGAIPFGRGPAGTRQVLATQAMNPWATIPQLLRGATRDVSELGLNPFAMGALEAYERAHGQIAPVPFAWHTLQGIGRNLPLSRVAKPLPPSRLYPRRGYRSEILGWLGLPVKQYDPQEATWRARQGR